jgi:hypothetical protein
VSYCCGDQTILEDINLNDVSVQIPASAARALRGIRRDQILNVWIDAVCINPGDPNERTHQVLLMSNIYSSACQTFVWLESEGEEAENLLTAGALDCQQQLQRHDLSVTTDLKALIYGDSELPESVRDAAWKLFASLLVYLKQPWFSRLWVYQEVLLSQKVWFQAGPVKLTWAII